MADQWSINCLGALQKVKAANRAARRSGKACLILLRDGDFRPAAISPASNGMGGGADDANVPGLTSHRQPFCGPIQ